VERNTPTPERVPVRLRAHPTLWSRPDARIFRAGFRNWVRPLQL